MLVCIPYLVLPLAESAGCIDRRLGGRFGRAVHHGEGDGRRTRGAVTGASHQSLEEVWGAPDCPLSIADSQSIHKALCTQLQLVRGPGQVLRWGAISAVSFLGEE